ncbi:hypothetical protein DQM08_01420 [Lactiplantibacillus paraplantarum]|nr:hypothetical protein DQM08_01420 [Lactiplantibacillus paraplantarum]
MLERSRRRFELTPNPRHLKYESYSKPEEIHFQLRIIWLLSIVTQPLQSKSLCGLQASVAPNTFRQHFLEAWKTSI